MIGAFNRRVLVLLDSKVRFRAALSGGHQAFIRSDRLTAPSLSFDWHEPDEDGLQVELPERAKTIEGRRALLHDELRRVGLRKACRRPII